MQHVERSGLEGPWTTNGSAVSVDCLPQRSQKELVIFVYSNSHSFLLQFDLFGGWFCGFFLFFAVFIARFPFGMFSALCGWWVSTVQWVAVRCCFVCVKASDGKMLSCVSESAPCAAVSSGWTESLASPHPVHPAATCTTGWTGLWDSQGPAKAVKGRRERGWDGITLTVGSWDCGL